MFGLVMTLGVLGNVDSGLVVFVDMSQLILTIVKIFLNQVASWVVAASATYSVSAVKRVTHVCFWLPQLTAALLIIKR